MAPTMVRQRSCTLSIRLAAPPSQAKEQPRRPSHQPTKSSPMLVVPGRISTMRSSPDIPPMDSQHIGEMSLEKYVLLNEHHHNLTQRLDKLLPLESEDESSAPSSAGAHAPMMPGQPMPTVRRATAPIATTTAKPPRAHMRRMRTTATASPADQPTSPAVSKEIAVEEARLCNVNEGIKRALTELLNCSSVRTDSTFRSWVQRRLMEAEQELRHGRRRRSH